MVVMELQKQEVKEGKGGTTVMGCTERAKRTKGKQRKR